MNLRFLFIIVFTFFGNKAFGFEKFNLNDIDPYENIIVEDMFEPLKVTGDALPWQLFGKIKEVEDCTIDKDGFDYCLIKPIYDDKIKKFKLIALKNKKFSVKYILKIYAKLFSCLFKLKSLPLPIFIRSKIGVSQHFGSSLPPCENETIGNTLKNGELAFHKNIYVTDCSSLNRIPSTPPTFISMSNAYRISENITKNC